MARLPRVRFSVIEIPDDVPSNRGIPAPPREVSPTEDPLLARLLVHCARRALSSGPGLHDEHAAEMDPGEAELPRGFELPRSRSSMIRGEAPLPLGETSPSIDLPIQHQRWPRRDDAPRRPR